MSKGKANSSFEHVALSNGWRVGKFHEFDRLDGILHAVTTRRGLDPALVKDDAPAAGEHLAAAFGLKGVAFCEQVHGKTVVSVDSGGVAGPADAIVTNTGFIALMGRSADCPIILAADPIRGAVGMAHASWRGTAGRIASELIIRMVSEYDSRPEHIVAGICPSAGPCCYEVGRDVVQAVVGGVGGHAERFFQSRDGKTFLDLPAANRDELLHVGLLEENIHIAGVCTICHNDLYPSYRAEGAEAGRFVAFVAKV